MGFQQVEACALFMCMCKLKHASFRCDPFGDTLVSLSLLYDNAAFKHIHKSSYKAVLGI